VEYFSPYGILNGIEEYKDGKRIKWWDDGIKSNQQLLKFYDVLKVNRIKVLRQAGIVIDHLYFFQNQ
jgi:hypothetical protein